jgi:hypothetical protein
MAAVQRAVIYRSRLKGHDYKRIHTKLVATYGRNAYTERSAKYWVRKYERRRRARADLSRTDSAPSEIAEALSKVLSEYPFGSTKYISAQRGTSRELVKRTIIKVLGMKRFSL